MDLLNTFLNLLVPVFGLCSLLVLWPALAIRSIICRLFRALFEENMRGKVVLVTGASSGIGEQAAYLYARKGAILVLVARREDRLRIVSDGCIRNGAMDVRAITADLSNENDCRMLIEDTINQYGRLDHLVNNAGLAPCFLFEEVTDTAPLNHIMDVDFWGYIYPTFYSLPHLKSTRGKIIVNASVTAWLPHPKIAIYNAAQAALVSFFDTLRIELGSSIGGITILTAGWIESEMTMGKLLNKAGQVKVLQDERDALIGPVPVTYAYECAKAMVRGAVRSQRYVRVPYWYTMMLLYRVFAPEVLDFLLTLVYMVPTPWRKDRAPISKILIDIPGMKRLMYPTTISNSHPTSLKHATR